MIQYRLSLYSYYTIGSLKKSNSSRSKPLSLELSNQRGSLLLRSHKIVGVRRSNTLVPVDIILLVYRKSQLKKGENFIENLVFELKIFFIVY